MDKNFARETADSPVSATKTKSITNIVLNDFKNDSRVLKISKSLAKTGYRVRVVAMHEPTLPLTDDMAGFEVRRIELFFARFSPNKIVHLFKYLEFTLRLLLRFNDHDIYHCNDLHALPAGILLKTFSRRQVKIVYDAHEYETESRGVKGFEKTFRRLLEGFLIRFTDRRITVSNSIAGEYARIYNIEKPAVLLNIPSLSNESRHDLFRQNLGIGAQQKIFLYQGGLSYGRGIEVLMDTFDGAIQSDSVLVLMGYGELESDIRQRADNSQRIFFHPAVPPDQIPLYTSSADVGISTIENICLSYYYCLPNKLFEYLMAEIPVIVSNLFEMANLVNQYGLGVVAQENSVSGINQAVIDMESFDLEAFSHRVKPFKAEFNWEAQETTLIEIYADL